MSGFVGNQAGSEPAGYELDQSSTFNSSAPANSPRWWLDRLEPKLRARAGDLKVYDEYFRGNHRLAFATEQFKKAFGNTFRAFSDNFMQMIVAAMDQRLRVEGFRVPAEDQADLTTGDSEAWDIWQANRLDSGSHMVHADALTLGPSYVIVGPGGDYPEITGESAMQVICESDAGYRHRRLAALKKWKGEDGFIYATVYLPDVVAKFMSRTKVSSDGGKIDWKARIVGPESWPMPNPLGVVPVVPFCNRPTLLTESESEIAQLIPLQDALNYLFMCMLVAAEYMGFPQRTISGIEIPTDPETNQPVTELWRMALDRMLHSPDPATTFGALPSADLSNYTNAIAMGVQHLATRSATPPHYFLASMGNFPSGESLKAAETGLVAKVRDQQRHFGESWEEVLRLAFLAAGKPDKAKQALGAETIWGDPETRTESEHVDAMVKMGSLGVPAEILWEKSGMFSPQEIARMKELIKQGSPPLPMSVPVPVAERITDKVGSTTPVDVTPPPPPAPSKPPTKSSGP